MTSNILPIRIDGCVVRNVDVVKEFGINYTIVTEADFYLSDIFVYSSAGFRKIMDNIKKLGIKHPTGAVMSDDDLIFEIRRRLLTNYTYSVCITSKIKSTKDILINSQVEEKPIYIVIDNKKFNLSLVEQDIVDDNLKRVVEQTVEHFKDRIQMLSQSKAIPLWITDDILSFFYLQEQLYACYKENIIYCPNTIIYNGTTYLWEKQLQIKPIKLQLRVMFLVTELDMLTLKEWICVKDKIRFRHYHSMSRVDCAGTFHGKTVNTLKDLVLLLNSIKKSFEIVDIDNIANDDPNFDLFPDKKLLISYIKDKTIKQEGWTTKNG